MNGIISDFCWKFIVGGQGGVGKTTLLYRFVHNEFVENMVMTIGVQFHKQFLERNGNKISLILWDLGGQDQFKSIHKDYIRGASAGVVCFDLSNRSTFEGSIEWIKMFQHSMPGLPILLVGTKFDLIKDNNDVIIKIIEDANNIVKQYGLLGVAFTSAKDGDYGFNVVETIYYMVDVLLSNMNLPQESILCDRIEG